MTRAVHLHSRIEERVLVTLYRLMQAKWRVSSSPIMSGHVSVSGRHEGSCGVGSGEVEVVLFVELESCVCCLFEEGY